MHAASQHGNQADEYSTYLQGLLLLHLCSRLSQGGLVLSRHPPLRSMHGFNQRSAQVALSLSDLQCWGECKELCT